MSIADRICQHRKSCGSCQVRTKSGPELQELPWDDCGVMMSLQAALMLESVSSESSAPER